MTRSKWFFVGGVGCLLMGVAGLFKTFDGDAPLGLLLVGFSISLFENMWHVFRQSPE